MPTWSSQSLVVGPKCELDNLASRSLLLADVVWDNPRLGHQSGANTLIWGDFHIQHKMTSRVRAVNSLPTTLGFGPPVGLCPSVF